MLGVVDDQLLTENVDILPRAARKADAVGIRRGEFHRVADLVTPQAVVRGDQHGVDLAALHAFERHDLRPAAELEEGSVIQHQQHVAARRVVGHGEESLRSVVGLHVFHLLRRNQLLERRPVGRELHASVGEHLQPGPHLQQIFPARILQHAAHQREVP